jgi:hypothetical protein
MTLLSGLCLLLLPNCGNNNSSSTAGPGAATMSAQCMSYPSTGMVGQPCTFPYSNYSGFSAYNNGCTGSQVPVYSASKGLGCVDTSQMSMIGTPVQYALQGAAFVPVGYQGGQVLRACDSVDQCASPNRCLPPYASNPYGYGTPAGTGLGVCFQ